MQHNYISNKDLRHKTKKFRRYVVGYHPSKLRSQPSIDLTSWSTPQFYVRPEMDMRVVETPFVASIHVLVAFLQEPCEASTKYKCHFTTLDITSCAALSLEIYFSPPPPPFSSLMMNAWHWKEIDLLEWILFPFGRCRYHFGWFRSMCIGRKIGG